jgi:hypothetical protein
MRFRSGILYPHPPRGPGRHGYRLTDAALRSRRQSLSRCPRLRSDRESEVIKLLIWQAYFDAWPRPSQRVLARQLGVWPSYVSKVQKQWAKGREALSSGQRATLEDLEEARRLREQEPGLLSRPRQPTQADEPPVMTAHESIAATWREVNEWKRKNRSYGVRRVLFSVPVRWE